MFEKERFCLIYLRITYYLTAKYKYSNTVCKYKICQQINASSPIESQKKTKTKNQTNGATLGGRGFPQDESPGTSSLGGESLLPMVMKTSGLDISIVGGPLQCPLASHFSQQVKGISGPAGK